MKTVTIKELCKEIELASAVIIDNDGLCYPSVWYNDCDYDGDTAIHMSWTDDEGYEFRCDISNDEQDIKFDETSYFLVDDGGTETKLTPLYPKNP